MALESIQLSVVIDRPVDEVYAYTSNPVNLPSWAAGLSSEVFEEDGHWYADMEVGRVEVVFAPRNEFGILDHWVTLPTGDVVYNPLRVFANEDSSEVVFTLRRMPGMSDEDFEGDRSHVAADLSTLKGLLEAE